MTARLTADNRRVAGWLLACAAAVLTLTTGVAIGASAGGAHGAAQPSGTSQPVSPRPGVASTTSR